MRVPMFVVTLATLSVYWMFEAGPPGVQRTVGMVVSGTAIVALAIATLVDLVITIRRERGGRT